MGRSSNKRGGESGPVSKLSKSDGRISCALRKVAIIGNIPPMLSSRTRRRRVHTGVEEAALQSFLPAVGEVDEVDEEDDENNDLACYVGDAMTMQATFDIPEPTVGYMTPDPRN